MAGNDAQNGRIEWLHDDLNDLRKEMRSGFESIHAKLDTKADADAVRRLAERVRSLERWRAWLTGGAAAVSGLLGWLTGRGGGGGAN